MTESGALRIPLVKHLSSHHSLLLAAALVLAGNGGCVFVLELITVLVAVTLVLSSRDPQARLPVQGLVLAREVDALTMATALVAAALRKGTRSLGELGRDGCVLGNPVGKSILAVLDDTVKY